MKYLKDFKIYEGLYDDMITDINKKKEEISKLKDSYLKSVKECLLEITDEWEPHTLSYSRDIDNDESYGEYEVYCKLSIKQSDIDKFMSSFFTVSDLIKSYLGEELKFEIIGAYIAGDSLNNYDDFSENFNKVTSNDEKVRIFKKGISDLIEEYPDETGDILIEMIIV